MYSPLQALDWVVILGYLAALIGLSAWLGRFQGNARDYYLTGNRMGPLATALSTAATQLSTNSLLGVPALVALGVGGGLVWLQFELAVPLAMIVLMLVIFPVFRRLRIISVYAYLERRFDARVRVVMSLLFQVFRAASTGITIYGISLVLALALGVPLGVAILILLGVTLVYDLLGGMRAVMVSDIIQVVVLVASILFAIGIAVDLMGGFGAVWSAFPEERQVAVDLSTLGLTDGQHLAFFPLLLGGFFLYLAYYGVDQTQAQRELSARDLTATGKALFYDGLLRFPLVATYCFLGVCIGAYAAIDSGFVDRIGEVAAAGGIESGVNNLAVPVFVFEHFPVGLVGLVVVGLLAAAMSSVDSTLNSLSATTTQDLVLRWRKTSLTGRQELWLARGLTVFWGCFCAAFAFGADAIAGTIVEAINKVGSLINGPLLAVFVLGMLVRKAGVAAALCGLVLGFGANALVALSLPGVSWPWWNVIGFGVCLGVGTVVAMVHPRRTDPDPDTLYHRQQLARETGRPWTREVLTLVAYAGLILVVLFALGVRPG